MSAGSSYRRISPERLWSDAKVRNARKISRDAHDLFLYCMTCDVGTFIGIFRLTESHAVDQLRWTRPRFRRAIKAAVELSLLHFDATEEIVYIPMILESDPIATEAQATGAIRRLESLPESVLIEQFRKDVLTLKMVKISGKTRGLLIHLGLADGQTPVTPPSDAGLTPTPSPYPLPSPTHTPWPAPRNNQGGEEDGPDLQSLGNGRTNGPSLLAQYIPIPLADSAAAWEKLILPLTGEPEKRGQWMRALDRPGALDALNRAHERTSKAMRVGGVRSPGALLWSEFQKASA